MLYTYKCTSSKKILFTRNLNKSIILYQLPEVLNLNELILELYIFTTYYDYFILYFWRPFPWIFKWLRKSWRYHQQNIDLVIKFFWRCAVSFGIKPFQYRHLTLFSDELTLFPVWLMELEDVGLELKNHAVNTPVECTSNFVVDFIMERNVLRSYMQLALNKFAVDENSESNSWQKSINKAEVEWVW